MKLKSLFFRIALILVLLFATEGGYSIGVAIIVGFMIRVCLNFKEIF